MGRAVATSTTIKMAVLSVALEYPGTGYDIAKRFIPRFCPPYRTHLQNVYVHLDHLRDGGLVGKRALDARAADARRGASFWTATADGAHAFQDWIASDIDPEWARPDLFVRLRAVRAVRGDDSPTMLALIDSYQTAVLASVGFVPRGEGMTIVDELARRSRSYGRCSAWVLRPGTRAPAGAPRRRDQMMASSLLSLDSVTQRFPHGTRPGRERIALREVSLEIAAGEFVAVRGRRRAGRTTLLEVCAGLRQPSAGTVRFDGQDLARCRLVGKIAGIGYAHPQFDPQHGVVVEQVALPLYKDKVRLEDAHACAHDVLELVSAAECAEMLPDDLDPGELLRVILARALITQPRLLLMDDPVPGVAAPERDAIFRLIRALTRDRRLAVLLAVEEISGAHDLVDRGLSIGAGELRGATRPEAPAPVVELRPSSNAG